jgi:hypothetical protein
MTDEQIAKLAQGFWQRKSLAETAQETVSYKFDAMGFARAILQAASAAPQEPASASVGREMQIMHSVLQWNREQEKPPIAIAKEYGVASKVLELAAEYDKTLAAPASAAPVDDAKLKGGAA